MDVQSALEWPFLQTDPFLSQTPAAFSQGFLSGSSDSLGKPLPARRDLPEKFLLPKCNNVQNPRFYPC